MHFWTVVGTWLLSYQGILVSAVSAVFGLYSERLKDRRWKWLAVAGIVAGMFLALASAKQDADQHQQNMANVIDKVNAFDELQTQKIIDDLSLLRSQLPGFGVLPSVAQTASPDQVGEILKAGNALGTFANLETPAAQQALTIRVFNHFTKDVNFKLVEPRLQQLSDHVTVLAPLIETPTNSVWWGPGSSLEVAKAAALIAMSAGVQIKQICPSEKPHPDVSDLIQIGGAAEAQSMPVLTVE
jgi:hypothetical protein